MNNKSSKIGIVVTIVLTLLGVGLLNVFTFAIPFNSLSNEVYYTVYACAELAILIEGVLIGSQFFLEKNNNQKIMSLPISFYSSVTLILQLVCTISFYAINAFIITPIWIVAIVECLIFAFGIIQVSRGFFYKIRTKQYHENISNTSNIDELRTNLKIVLKTNTNLNVERELNNLVDTALGSDPVSNEKTIELEQELINLSNELKTSISNGLEEPTRELINKINSLLIERNVICKASK